MYLNNMLEHASRSLVRVSFIVGAESASRRVCRRLIIAPDHGFIIIRSSIFSKQICGQFGLVLVTLVCGCTFSIRNLHLLCVSRNYSLGANHFIFHQLYQHWH